MGRQLQRNEIRNTIEALVERFPRDECRTCDCFQGFLTQLEIDTMEDISDITGPLKVPTEEMHGCLGCDPCPPGEAFSNYIREHQK